MLWCLIPIVSLGLLTWVPAVQAWWKARTAGWAVTAALLVAGAVGVGIGMAADTSDNTVLGMLYIGGAIGGTVAAVAARPIVFAGPESWRRIDHDVARVLDQRERRDEARRIAETDPPLALELGIGRPDRTRSYDDGGVVDLNNAGAGAIAATLGWSRATAQGFTAERDARGGYESLTELVAMSTLSPRSIDRVSDRVVVLPYVRTPD